MKKQGFTLVELLAVLVILSVVFMIVAPSVNKLLSQGKDTIYKTQINNILNSAYDYSLKNVKFLPSYNNTNYITLGELKYEGMIDADIEDPQSKEKFEDNLVISIKNVGAGYKYSNEFAKLKGDYLYTVEFDRNDNLDLLPEIELSDLSKNSKGDYVLTLELNEEFDEAKYSYSAKSSIGEDLTTKVKKYILLDNTTVDNIDSSKSAVYKIKYSVIDDNGYATSSTLSVIIADTVAPVITLPENNKIGKDETSFDLNNGVICEDNSDYCTITVSGEIDFGVIGKYIITYTAKDPSGNTSTKKRVITIE